MSDDPANDMPGSRPEKSEPVDPLLLKAVFCPWQLTPEEKWKAELLSLSVVMNLMPDQELKKIAADVAKNLEKKASLPAKQQRKLEGFASMLSGKLALREMGLQPQSKPQVWAYLELLDKEKKHQARMAKRQEKAAALRAQAAAAKKKKSSATAKTKKQSTAPQPKPKPAARLRPRKRRA